MDLTRVRRVSIDERRSLVSLDDFAPALVPPYHLPCFPGIGAGREMMELAGIINRARDEGAETLAGFGGHLVKVGLSRIIIQLMEEGFITAVATNGAGMIHDFEIASFGRTSEDVGSSLLDGEFGFAAETADALNAAASRAASEGLGLGEAVGEFLAGAPHADASILAAAYRLGLPATVHVGYGTDIIHQHPNADGAATGAATARDFRILASVVSRLGAGGVYLNIGSAVILPEVFLKAAAVAANLGASFGNLTTAVLDQILHYRPRVNVLERPSAGGGRSFALIGRHEILIPILASMILKGTVR